MSRIWLHAECTISELVQSHMIYSLSNYNLLANLSAFELFIYVIHCIYYNSCRITLENDCTRTAQSSLGGCSGRVHKIVYLAVYKGNTRIGSKVMPLANFHRNCWREDKTHTLYVFSILSPFNRCINCTCRHNISREIYFCTK